MRACMSRELFTVGYEGRTVDELIAYLRSKNVNCIVDVRQAPFSRKPGFSKNQLARSLRRTKIDYVHLGELGTPKDLRDNLKSTGNYSLFFKKMDKYLDAKRDIIEEAYHYVMNNQCCLMCFEKFAEQCHRKIVAEKIKDRDGDRLQIKHI
jgi:uncharacterized protein (DUF488 family)